MSQVTLAGPCGWWPNPGVDKCYTSHDLQVSTPSFWWSIGFCHHPHWLINSRNSGFYRQFHTAVEHGPVERVDFPIKHGGSVHSLPAQFTRGPYEPRTLFGT